MLTLLYQLFMTIKCQVSRKLDVRMVIAGCKTDRPYLYVSASEEFWSEKDLVSFAKECDLRED